VDRAGKRLAYMKRHWALYAMLLLPIVYIIIFNYVPMYGLQIAFKNFSMKLGFSGSKWVGFYHFNQFLKSPMFPRLIGNTVGISLYSIAANFLPPIILAIALNECRSHFLKRGVQMVTYAPYFLSTVVVVGIVVQVLSLNGILNSITGIFGKEAVSFMSDPKLFKSIYVWSGVWQSTGYGSIIYIAALSGISVELQEAAVVDGANIWQRIWHVDIPGILPTAIIMLILSTAGILNVGFEKVFLMQNNLNMQTSDVISTYVYRIGLVDMNYSFATAVGLFQSVISLAFMCVVNAIAKRTSEISLW
jgi:putative aldouronate transport system permease protein